MPSFTLKGIPEELMERLRQQADLDRRSLNQQVIAILDRALPTTKQGSFAEAYSELMRKWGSSPLLGEEFEGLRDRRPGRDVEPTEL